MKKVGILLGERGKIEKSIALLEKKLEAEKKKAVTIRTRYPFVCKHCGLAFRHSEVGYKVYESRKEHQTCLPMGEYDIYQYVVREELACCPKCGHNFKARVWYDRVIKQTRTYGRWDEKPDFQRCYTKCISKRIMKMDEDRKKFLAREL